MIRRPSTRNRSLWTVERISTAIWLDGLDESTFTLVSGAASQWRDKSGNARHANQSNASLRPIRSATGITLNGTRHLTCSPSWGNFWCWFLVLKFDRTDVLQVPIRDDGSGDGTAIVGYSTPSAFFYRSRNASDTSYSTSIANEFGTTKRIHTFNSKNNNQTDAYVDGTLKTTWAASGVMGGTLYLGVNGTALNNGLQGSIDEFILLSGEATIQTIQKVTGYLAHKHGIESNLPSNHPFRNYPPRGA